MLMPITSLKKGWEYKGVSYTETKSLQWSTKMKPKLLPIPPLVPLRPPHSRGEDFITAHGLRVWLEPPPTGVGKTEASDTENSVSQKHPHGRGEDTGVFFTRSSEIETPPRAWGRLVL